MSNNEILAYIPQRPPFVMVSDVLHADGQLSKTSFKITDDNILTKDGFLTEAGLVENMAQTAAAGTGFLAKKENKKVQVGYIGALKNLNVISLPKVGETITTEMITKHQIFNAHVVEGKVKVGDIEIANCELKIFLQSEN